jgi:hypothetical protein
MLPMIPANSCNHNRHAMISPINAPHKMPNNAIITKKKKKKVRATPSPTRQVRRHTGRWPHQAAPRSISAFIAARRLCISITFLTCSGGGEGEVATSRYNLSYLA